MGTRRSSTTHLSNTIGIQNATLGDRRPLAAAPRRRSLIVQVNRAMPLVYLSRTEPLYPELAEACPDQFDLSVVAPWVHQGQRNRSGMQIASVFDQIKKGAVLATYLGLRELYAIRALPVAVVAEFFGEEGVLLHGPRSTVKDPDGIKHMPYIVMEEDRVTDGWTDFSAIATIDEFSPMLRHAAA